MATQHKWNLDRKVTAMMIEDMMFDPILAIKVLLGIRLPPHQELRILTNWTTAWTNDDSGFSTGKTANNAMLAAIRSILFSGRVSGVISKTYAQGKLTFEYFDKWSNANPRFRNCLRFKQGKPQLVHGSDVHFANFRGGSQIRVLPPDFMKDSERLRSERWNDAYCDEWTTYGNMDALNKTIVGRVTNVNHYPDCPVRQNHIHLSSTPGFMHDPAYGLIKIIARHVASGNPEYARFTSNYRHIPVTPDWKHLVNRKTIFHMQTTLSRGSVRSEIDGLWQKESGQYYSSASISRARYRMGPTYVPKRTRSEEVFICGVDIARGGGSQRQGGGGDDCAITVLRVTSRAVHQCCTIRRNGITDIQLSGIIHQLHQIYGFSCIGYDPGGGGLFLKDRLKASTQIIDNVPTQCKPICEFGDQTMGDQILIPIKRGEYWITKMWGKMQSDSVLVNRMHKHLRDCIDSGNLTLSGEWSGWTGNESKWDAAAKRIWLNNNYRSLPREECIKADMDLAVSQLILVDIERDSNNVAVLDSYMMYKFGSKSKKDSAYSLLYANTAYKAYLTMVEAGFVQEIQRGKKGRSSIAFEPF